MLVQMNGSVCEVNAAKIMKPNVIWKHLFKILLFSYSDIVIC